MDTLIIPQKITQNGDLIIIPRKEYESLLVFKKNTEFLPTTLEKSALKRAEENLKRGKTLSYNELIKRLGFTN